MPPEDRDRWMWAEACQMLERAERLHRQFFQIRPSPEKRPLWEPPVDVIETTEEVGILVALPGVEPSEIRVSVDGDTLVVSGVRSMPPVYRMAAIHRLEVPHGRFERRLQLTWDRLELRGRDVLNGCLLLTFRKLP